jgi:sulfotransferase
MVQSRNDDSGPSALCNMAPRIVFQASLPRSGSTLFSNIIGQNPDFHVTPTSGLLDLLYVARAQFSNGAEFKAQDRGEMERAFAGFCRGGLEGYASALTDKPWLLDKSRGWGIHYRFHEAFYPNPKIVCMVRDPADILCSMELKFRQASLQDPGLVNHSELQNTTLEKRLDHWVASPPVGLAMERLLEILRQGIDQHMLFISYDKLCSNPHREIEGFYRYLDLPRYDWHEYKNVVQVTAEDDAVYGIFGDHRIRPAVEPRASQARAVLGDELCEWIRQRYSWYYARFSD